LKDGKYSEKSIDIMATMSTKDSFSGHSSKPEKKRTLKEKEEDSFLERRRPTKDVKIQLRNLPK